MGQHQICQTVPRLVTIHDDLKKKIMTMLNVLLPCCILSFCLIVSGSDSSDAKTGGVFFSGKPVIRRAMELADAVMFDSPEKRLKMPLCTDPSDDEEEDEEMEVTWC